MKRIILFLFVSISLGCNKTIEHHDTGQSSFEELIVEEMPGGRIVIPDSMVGEIFFTEDSGEKYQHFPNVDNNVKSKLKYVLNVDNNEFDYGTNIKIDFFLHNDSAILIGCASGGNITSNGVNQWIITDEGDCSIPQTLWSKRDFDNDSEPRFMENVLVGSRSRNMVPSGETFRLGPVFLLNHLFDLSRPGMYNVKAIRGSFSSHHMFDEPLESNTVEFRIRYGSEFTEIPLEGLVVGDTIDPPRLEDLPPAGDYSQLRLIVHSDQSQYQRMQGVFVHCFLKNESESEIHLCIDPSMFWQDQRWVVTNENDEEVPLTRMGQLRFGKVPPPPEEVDWCFSDPCFVALPPGETVEIIPGAIQLNRYFDLTLPGKYKFKSLRNTVIPGQKFDSPLESNEVEFEITSGSYFNPGDLVDPGCFDNTEEQIGESSENCDTL